MPNTTEIYGLIKPFPEEFYDIAVHNNNMDRIDELFYRAIHGSGTLADGSNANSLAGNNTWYSLNPDYTYVNFPVTGNWCILIIHDKSAILQVLNGGMFYCNNLAMEVPAWIQLLDTKGGTIEGSLTVNGGVNVRNGRGYFSANEGQVVLAHRTDPDAPSTYLSVRRTQTVDGSLYLVKELDDGTAENYLVYHSGNLDISKLGSAGLTPASIE